MNMICQIFVLAIVMGIVWYLGYYKGRTIKERELQSMEYPELTKKDKEKLRKYFTEEDNDDFFTGNIAKSSRTDTNKDEKQK